ncbi:unnamed protein product [Protopolystoma xenopodis]|uniref:Uncharacterized protein n=1 Tax=Protopolystoma xenopodis TaxID=117903 RepID=A0A448W9R2_9PLAT|nr:unnamed protein product [Protopolystoma xenopodis]
MLRVGFPLRLLETPSPSRIFFLSFTFLGGFIGQTKHLTDVGVRPRTSQEQANPEILPDCREILKRSKRLVTSLGIGPATPTLLPTLIRRYRWATSSHPLARRNSVGQFPAWQQVDNTTSIDNPTCKRPTPPAIPLAPDLDPSSFASAASPAPNTDQPVDLFAMCSLATGSAVEALLAESRNAMISSPLQPEEPASSEPGDHDHKTVCRAEWHGDRDGIAEEKEGSEGAKEPSGWSSRAVSWALVGAGLKKASATHFIHTTAKR